MKVRIILFGILTIGIVHARRVPNTVFNASEYAEAKAEAASNQRETGGLREWTDVRGRAMKPEFVHADTHSATFKLENGKVIDLPFSKLSSERQAVLEKCHN